MLAVQVAIVAWVDDVQPGWVAAQFVDAWGSKHRFIDKVPIFTAVDLDRDSTYPQSGVIACKIVDTQPHPDGHELLIINTEKPWGVMATTGATHFAVIRAQLIEI